MSVSDCRINSESLDEDILSIYAPAIILNYILTLLMKFCICFNVFHVHSLSLITITNVSQQNSFYNPFACNGQDKALNFLLIYVPDPLKSLYLYYFI